MMKVLVGGPMTDGSTRSTLTRIESKCVAYASQVICRDESKVW
jgi:hypothetical protein